jgi:hypothetical protein
MHSWMRILLPGEDGADVRYADPDWILHLVATAVVTFSTSVEDTMVSRPWMVHTSYMPAHAPMQHLQFIMPLHAAQQQRPLDGSNIATCGQHGHLWAATPSWRGHSILEGEA